MSHFIKNISKCFNLLIVIACLSLIVSCDSGINKARKSAEAAKEEVAKSGAYNFFPGKYKKALKQIKKAGKQMEKKQIEKAQRFYDTARKKLLEINSKGLDKKSNLESGIQSALSEIEGAKQKAKTSLDAVSDSCVSEIADKVLGKSSSGKDVVLKYFDKLKERAQKQFSQAEEQISKATALVGDENLKKKSNKLKSILDTFSMVDQAAVEICTNTESMVLKNVNKKSKPHRVKKQKLQTPEESATDGK